MDVKNDLRSKIRDIPDYPKPGILFKDITPMLSDAKSFSDCISELCKEVESKVGTIDYVLGIEARGFIIGSALARNVIDRLHSNKTRLNIVGNKKLLPKDLRDSLHRVELETKKYSDKVINMLIGYGGRDDLMSAARSIAKKFPKGNVTEEEFGNFLISRSIPEIDFVIRTSGEKRLSGFMPWQAGYAELYFSKKLWPDFTRNDLHTALVDYSNRQRRFGR